MFGLILEPEEKKLLPFRGMPVCLLMKDGSRKIGLLTSCGSGRLVLNGEFGNNGEVTVSRKTAARRTNRKRGRKPQESAEPLQLHAEGDRDGLPFAQIGPEPMFSSMPRENVPLKSVDSIVVL
jgi:hypothetical protein